MANELTPIVEKNYELRRRIVSLTIIPVLVLMTVILTVPLVLPSALQGKVDVDITGALLITIAAEILVILWGLTFGGLWATWREKLFFKNFRWKHVFIGIVFGQFFYWGLQAIAWIAEVSGAPIGSSDTAVSLGSLEGALGIIILLVIVPFVGPFIEEFLFRGLIVGGLRETRWSAPWIGITISAITFGIMHFQGFSNLTSVAILLWITFMGAAFAFMYYKLQSFWAAFAAHSVYNLTSSILMVTGIVG